MKIPNHLETHRFGFNMTPMIDVVFLLIIFFLVSMDLAKQETRMELELSEADTGLTQLDEEGQVLTVNLDDEGKIFVMGREITLAQLKIVLANRRDEVGENLEVRIRASRFVEYGLANPIMLACVDAGIWDVEYVVVRRERGQQ